MTKRALRLHVIYNTITLFYFIILLSSNHHVLDVGSGLGGPARYLAHKTGCLVTAIELQDDLHREAENLTQRCNLQQKLKHITGDFLQMDLGGYSYQARVFLLISWHALEYPTQLTSPESSSLSVGFISRRFIGLRLIMCLWYKLAIQQEVMG